MISSRLKVETMWKHVWHACMHLEVCEPRLGLPENIEISFLEVRTISGASKDETGLYCAALELIYWVPSKKHLFLFHINIPSPNSVSVRAKEH